MEHPSIIFKIVCPDRPGLVSLLTSWISNYGGDEVNGQFNVNYSDEIPNVAIFVSKQNHCLIDLLWRVRNGELKMKVPLIISNHSHLENIANDFNAKFVHIDTFKTDKTIVEDHFLNLLKEYDIDLVVLAKYMQILSDSFLKKFSSIINIHHSFLPAFKGGQPAMYS